MDHYTLYNGFHPVNREDLQKLLKQLSGAASRVWLAYIAYPAEELNPDPNAEYMPALSMLTNQDIMDATGLCETSVTKGRDALCKLGELERVSRGVYKILHYKKLKYIRVTGENNGETTESLGQTSKMSGDTAENTVLHVEGESKTTENVVSNHRICGFVNGDNTNGHQDLEQNSGSLRKERKEEEENNNIFLLLAEYKKGIVDHIGIEDEKKLDQYYRWLKTGIGADGKVDIWSLVGKSRPLVKLNRLDPDQQAIIERLEEAPVMHVLDGLWAATEQKIHPTGWLRYVGIHVDQWENYHKDDLEVLKAQADEKKREYQHQRELSQKRASITGLLGDDYIASMPDQLVVEKLAELEKEEIIALVKQCREEKQPKRLMEYLHTILIESEVADVE